MKVANAKTKKIKEQLKETKKKISKLKEYF